MNTDGTANDNTANQFNDTRLILRTSENGLLTIEDAWEATTEPGRPYEEHPERPEGVARIAFGQYKAWVVGTHRDHEALLQAGDISIYRDLNKDWKRDGDKLYTGMFGINQHWGYDLPRNDVGRASAGCLVGRTRDGHRRFMALVKRDPRYVANNGYRFMTAVLPVSALTEARFDAAAPR